MIKTPEEEVLNFKNFIFAISGVLLVWLPVIFLHLTIALFAFLVTFTASRRLSIWFKKIVPTKFLRYILALLVVLIVLIAFLFYLINFLIDASQQHTNFSALSSRIIEILHQVRFRLPESMAEHIPANVDQIRTDLAQWIGNNTKVVQTWGKNALHAIGYAIFGILIGALALFQIPERPPANDRPLSKIFLHELNHLSSAFSNVVYAQIQISAINTCLTALYLFVILPLFGHKLPLSTTLVVFTFLSGLIPILGNLASSTAIVILSLGDTNLVIVLSIIWLILVHKLEYFLNAHIIGNKVHAKAWELLIVMLFLEAAFGLAGIISAPIIYAQVKKICMRKGWINPVSTNKVKVILKNND